MAIQFISQSEVEAKVGNEGIKIVNYYGDWCGPCKMFAPTLEELSGDYEVFKIDIDKNKEEAKAVGVSGLPFTRIYKDGKQIGEFTGFIPKEKILETIG